MPDVEALKSGPTLVVVGIGIDSSKLLTYRTSTALAELLGIVPVEVPVEFPVDYGGFMCPPAEFADALRTMLGH